MSENDLWNKSDDEPRIPSTSIVSDAELGLDEAPPELEATELELAWYRAVARNMRFYGRQWFLALSGLGLSYAAIFGMPSVQEGNRVEWADLDLLIVAVLLPVIGFSLLGYWAYRSGSFPSKASKRTFSEEFDITITRSGYHNWMGSHVLLAPAYLLKQLRRGKAYEGEGFFVSKGGEDWLVPTKIGDWQVSNKDEPEPMNRVAGWFVVCIFQFAWPLSLIKWSLDWSDKGMSSVFYRLGIAGVALYLMLFIAFAAILVYRVVTNKRLKLPELD